MIKRLIALTFCFILPAKAADTGIIFLQYHHVAQTSPPITSISEQDFKQHLDYLVDAKFTVWPLPRAVTALREKHSIPDRTVSITFDDAYESIYTNAYPLLKARNFSFTIFVATELVGHRGYLSWDQLREMHAAGATIANHTHTHTHLLRKRPSEDHEAWRSRIKEELTRAQSLLETEIGEASPYIAYPYGEYNPEIQAMVKALGYVAFGQQSGPAGYHTSLLNLPRFPLSGIYAEFESFKTKMNTRPMPVLSPDEDPLFADADFKPELTLHFPQLGFRLHQLACYGPGGRTEMTETAKGIYRVKNLSPVPVGRSRYNCTMPLNSPDKSRPKAVSEPVSTDKHTVRYHWFSQMWIRKNDDDSWYPEP